MNSDYTLNQDGMVDADLSSEKEPIEQTAENTGDQNSQDPDDSLPSSSMENIIPLEKLKKGWLTVSTFVAFAAQKVQDTAVDAYKSEQFQNIKQKTSEVVTPAWEKTCEVAAPIWENTKTTAHVAFEKTKENLVIATEQVKPTLETVSTQISTAASTGWKSVYEASSAAAEYTSEHISQFTTQMNQQSSGPQAQASAMDSATRGEPMTI